MFNDRGDQVDVFEFDHPITAEVKYHLRMVLELHYLLHPNGAVEGHTVRDNIKLVAGNPKPSLW